MKIATINVAIIHKQNTAHDNQRFNALDAAFAELIAEIGETPRENAGFTIIAAQRVDSITEIVLGRRESDGEYVTWVCYCQTDYNWGHYFGPEQLVDSMKDFIARCEQ